MGEANACAAVRRIATAVDWPCELHTLFRDWNLGCKAGVSSAITWFFQNEEQGIILEDDVLPMPSFFRYCDELLDRYREDERIAMISGCNLIANRFTPRASYFFSSYNHIWGWASWRRAWRHYDVRMSGWSEWVNGGGLTRVFRGDRLTEKYWRLALEGVVSRNVDTWDHQWTFACWKTGGMCVLPARNQTQNLGFGAGATHTTSNVPSYVKESKPMLLDFPLVHPKDVVEDEGAREMINRHIYKITNVGLLVRTILACPFAVALLRALQK